MNNALLNTCPTSLVNRPARKAKPPVLNPRDYKTPLRWAGNKDGFHKVILPQLVLRPGGIYYELFAGSAAIYFRMLLREDRPVQAYVSDINPVLRPQERARRRGSRI